MKDWAKTKIAVIICIFLFSIGLRINAPTADLPSHITFSGSILTDEGNQCHNSRSKALFNEWYPDQWRITDYNPILPYIKYISFKIFGVGLLQLRLISFLFAFLTLLFFFFTLKSYMFPQIRYAIIGTLLLGINFFYVMYNKIGTFETSMIFWAILALYFIEKYRSGNKASFLFLAGASASMAFVFKNIMAYIIPLPLAAYFIFTLIGRHKHPVQLKKMLTSMIYILLGIAVVYIPWYLFHYLPNKAWISSSPGKFMGNLMFPKTIKIAYANILGFNWKDQFYKIPIIWAGAILYIPFFLRRLLYKKSNITEIGYLLFFFIHTSVFMVMSYRPTRYFIPAIPVMIFLTVLLLKNISAPKSSVANPIKPWKRSLLFLGVTIWLALASYYCFLPLVSRYLYTFRVPSISFFYFIWATVVIGIVYVVIHFYRRLVWVKPNVGIFSVPCAFILILASIYININHYLDWHKNKKYSIRDMSIELGEKLDKAYIAGLTAPVAVLENQHKALWLYPNFVNWDRQTFKNYPLTHALIGTDLSDEINHFFSMWPDRMGRAKLLHIYHIKNYFLYLYSFIDPYISDIKMVESNQHNLTVQNPSSKVITTKIGKIYFSKPPPKSQTAPEFCLNVLPQEYELQPGKTNIPIPIKNTQQNFDSVLIFLQANSPYGNKILRCEGENFSRKTGIDMNDHLSSNGQTRYFNHLLHRPGFLSYGPGVPYSPGFIIADFNLTFSNFKTRIKNLCQLDLFSTDDGRALDQMKIKPGDIKKNKDNIFRLKALIPDSKKIEFRILIEKLADLAFDYIDITYYQGLIIDLNKKSPVDR